jgi:hypothetical protein
VMIRVTCQPQNVYLLMPCCLQIPRKVEEMGRENVDTSNICSLLPVMSHESVLSVKLVRSSHIGPV